MGNVGSVPNTELVLCLMYTRLSPNEFLKLKVSDYHGDYIVGGSKMEKGINRVITLSPKISKFVSDFAGGTKTIYSRLTERNSEIKIPLNLL